MKSTRPSKENKSAPEPAEQPPAPAADLLPFHRAADMFPLMEGDDFDALVADIQKHGLRERIVTFDEQIVDGRNRARACHKAGIKPVYKPFRGEAKDIVGFIISANIRRRHLSIKQRSELLERLIKQYPEKSDRQIAATAKVSPTTVGKMRKTTVQSGQLEKRIGKDGKARKQPTKKKRHTPEDFGRDINSKKPTEPEPVKPEPLPGDVGPMLPDLPGVPGPTLVEPAVSGDKPALWCSFCEKSRHEVGLLICANTEDDPAHSSACIAAHICNACVERCKDIIRSRTPPTDPTTVINIKMH